jgi:hypothetical protein
MSLRQKGARGKFGGFRMNSEKSAIRRTEEVASTNEPSTSLQLTAPSTRWMTILSFTAPEPLELVLCVIAALLALNKEYGQLLALAAMILFWMNAGRRK